MCGPLDPRVAVCYLVMVGVNGGSYCSVHVCQRPMCGSHGKVGVTVVCGPGDSCVAVL